MIRHYAGTGGSSALARMDVNPNPKAQKRFRENEMTSFFE